ncbi:MAG: SPOR domain-containing protein [Woeseiaceae bacterium]|nr:SPOR domain-containing protein [Woeseiaceae bacterium]
MKERIIGAVVLVVFVVLVVPIFLDGPPDDGEIVSQSVLLPGQEEQKTQTVVLDRDRTEPVPAASQPSPTPTGEAREATVSEQPEAERPVPAVEQREEAQAPPPVPEPVEEPADEPAQAASEPAAASTTGMWAVQLGSFSNKENAERLASDLRSQGYAAFISEVSTTSGQMHRVRIGPQKDRPGAEQMAARLARVGHDGKVVPHP